MARLMVMAAVLLMAGCGGGGGTGGPVLPSPGPGPTKTASDYLKDRKFTTDQPKVLEQVGVHHAYAKGLTGKGMRIGVEDTIVDYTQTGEFGDRVKTSAADGAKLYYDRYLTFADCSVVRAEGRRCFEVDSRRGADKEAINRKVREVVAEHGWPRSNDEFFIVDTSYTGSTGNEWDYLDRWKEIPTPYQDNKGFHGTFVASVAAGRSLGVAPEATVIPVAKNLEDLNDQQQLADADQRVRLAIQRMSVSERNEYDELLAAEHRAADASYDVLNRSWGTRATHSSILATEEDARWWKYYLPKSWQAATQQGSARKTLKVWAAGNDGDPVPALGAGLPYLFPEIRDHTIAVAWLDPTTDRIHTESNRCGGLPSDWSQARDGRHYCVTAPGTANGLEPGVGVRKGGGTSYAAPMVSGGLALMMEHFRGTRSNVQVLRRMMDTANNRGAYSDSMVYGAGLMDLEAALRPVGSTTVAGHDASRTRLVLPAAVSPRVAGLELAAFDSMGFPFWSPLGDRVVKAGGESPIPSFDEEATEIGAEALGQRFVDLGGSRFIKEDSGFRLGVASRSVSLSYRRNGWSYGLNFDDAGYLGGKPSGAFGSMRSGFSWVSHTVEKPMGWLSVRVTGTVALGSPWYEGGSIFRASSHLLSGVRVRVGTEDTGLAVEQPLRAESGTGVFRLENGRVEDGRRVVEEYKVSLRPRSREIRMTLRHDIPVGVGVMAMEVGASTNAGHETGEHAGRAGVAFKAAW